MDGITSTFRHIISKATTKLARYYTRKDRYYRYRNLRMIVMKDVFHPGLYRSTKVMAGWLETQPLSGLNIIELGCGSGLLALVAASGGARVTAVDINPKAVQNTSQNAKINNLEIDCFESDLLVSVPDSQPVDMAIVNPPYYPRDPVTDAEKAWFCGEGFGYFHRLFRQLAGRKLQDKCILILSDTCDISAIGSIASSNGMYLRTVFQQKVSGEVLTIYRCSAVNP